MRGRGDLGAQTVGSMPHWDREQGAIWVGSGIAGRETGESEEQVEVSEQTDLLGQGGLKSYRGCGAPGPRVLLSRKLMVQSLHGLKSLGCEALQEALPFPT